MVGTAQGSFVYSQTPSDVIFHRLHGPRPILRVDGGDYRWVLRGRFLLDLGLHVLNQNQRHTWPSGSTVRALRGMVNLVAHQPKVCLGLT